MAVLVTGASTGIGRKITERLAREGYFVYAGARKEQDLKDLDAIPNVHSLRLDVTSAGDIASVPAMLSKPCVESSDGRNLLASTSRSSRSRIAFAYSVRLRRWRPGGGRCVAAV